MAIEGGRGFEQSDKTSLAAILKDVEDRFEGNPEGAYQTLKGYLDTAVNTRRAALRESLLADPNVSVDDSLAFADLLDSALRSACADDLEIRGISDRMRSIRETQAAEAAEDERARDKAKQGSSLQAEIAKLQDFRDNLERLGLETTKEDVALASLRDVE